MPSPESLPSKMRELVYNEDSLEDYRQWRATQGGAMNPVMEVETVFDKQRAEFVRPRPSRYALLGIARQRNVLWLNAS